MSEPSAAALRASFDDNYRLTRMLARFLTYAPDCITKDMMDALLRDTDLREEEAYAYLLAAVLGLDMEESKGDRRFFRRYLAPSIRRLDPAPYREDPYFGFVSFPETKKGRWDLKTVTYPAYRGFIADDPRFAPDATELQALGFFSEDFSFPAVLEDGNEWMTLTPVDMDTCRADIEAAHGRVCTFGLGLGYYAFHVSEKENVSEITVVERSADVISLFEQVLLPQFPHREKLRIVHADAYDYMKHAMPRERFDTAFVDIWRDAGDGLPHYLRMRPMERACPDTQFSYWIEDTLLSRLRCHVFEAEWTKFEEGLSDVSTLSRKISRDSLVAFAKNGEGFALLSL